MIFNCPCAAYGRALAACLRGAVHVERHCSTEFTLGPAEKSAWFLRRAVRPPPSRGRSNGCYARIRPRAVNQFFQESSDGTARKKPASSMNALPAAFRAMASARKPVPPPRAATLNAQSPRAVSPQGLAVIRLPCKASFLVSPFTIAHQMRRSSAQIRHRPSHHLTASTVIVDAAQHSGLVCVVQIWGGQLEIISIFSRRKIANLAEKCITSLVMASRVRYGIRS